MCLAWMYSGSCSTYFGFFLRRRERGGRVEVEEVRKGQRKKKGRVVASFLASRFQCPIRRLNSPSLLRDAPPEACSRRVLREASKRGGGSSRITRGEPSAESQRGREPRGSIRRLLRPSTRTKDSLPYSLRDFRVKTRTRPCRRGAAPHLSRERRERERYGPSKTEGEQKKGGAGIALLLLLLLLLQNPTLFSTLFFPLPPNSRAPLPSPGRSCGGRVRACWPRGGASTTALAWLAFSRKKKRRAKGMKKN